MKFDRFDVVLVPFPFTDRHSQKRRPALVLSGHASFNCKTQHVVCAMITSAAHSEWPLDVCITQPDLAGLPKACVIRMKLFTLDDSLILKRLGRLSEIDASSVSKALTILLAS